MPQVTVLMPVYNGEKYLREAIDSILNQTFTDFEFLIIDDGSTDSSIKIISSYPDSRIKLIKNDNNQGLVYSLNKGLYLAQGEYIARMDCDDISLPKRLEKQLQFLNTNSNVGTIGTWVQVINAQKEPQTIWQYPSEDFAIKWSLCFNSPFAHPSVMFKKNLILSINGYDQNMTNAEDYDLWWRLSKITSFANLPEILLLYRQHNNSVTANYWQNHIEKVGKINQTIIENILNQKVNYIICHDLFSQNNQTFRKAKSISLLTLKIYHKTQQKNHYHEFESKYLKKETAKKIMKFIFPYILKMKGLRIFTFAFFLSPLAFYKLTYKKLFKKEFIRF